MLFRNATARPLGLLEHRAVHEAPSAFLVSAEDRLHRVAAGRVAHALRGLHNADRKLAHARTGMLLEPSSCQRCDRLRLYPAEIDLSGLLFCGCSELARQVVAFGKALPQQGFHFDNQSVSDAIEAAVEVLLNPGQAQVDTALS